eukprot:2047001-Karenia_brevis.AAC.1
MQKSQTEATWWVEHKHFQEITNGRDVLARIAQGADPRRQRAGAKKAAAKRKQTKRRLGEAALVG